MKTRVVSPLIAVLLVAPLAMAQLPVDSQFPSSAIGPSRGMDRGPNSMDYTLTGTVTDSQNHPLKQAHITISELGTGRVMGSSLSSETGAYQFPDLPPGEYLVTATSGLYQVQHQISLDSLSSTLDLRIPVQHDNGGVIGGNTVSVRQFEVPKKARKLLQEARKAYDDKQKDKAIQRTDAALQQYPDFGEALTLRAVLYLQDNQIDQARKLSEKAIKADPSYGLGYVVLGAAYNMLTRFDDALRVLGHAFSFTPDSWQGYYESARAHLGKKDYRKALEDTNRAAQYAPKNFTQIHLMRAQAELGLQDYSQAAVALQAYLKADPKGSEAAEAQRMLDQIQSSAPDAVTPPDTATATQ
jgi:outer membrane protein assembly factor BamD (BamD/ComL family)